MDQNKQTTPPDPQVAPTPGQKTQYVITQKSLNGIGGWLLFFMVVFVLVSIAQIGLFFQLLSTGVSTPSDTIAVVFAPLFAVAFLASVVFMAMRKKLAVLAAYAALGLGALYSVISTLVSTDDEMGGSLPLKISSVVIAVILYGLWALYFRQSRRVKETLIK